ncbi:lysophospholipid acyltransferase family protein [Williamsia sp.]|uniref:lysophospholipid acyltransferase family protein n=1 Tax=Williamsia sp. TaxID=1872085 RepID=UPI001A2CB2DE|nr:lysophospholipid acyltransferase family protein [Williamsia sp.]MBJ7291265.1 1-acyl-sn-glycerol-3-phosphate acyltransferase [Williamsia sp.]
MEPVYRTLEIAAHALVKAQGMRLDVRNADTIPSTGGAVIAINHTSYVDFVPAAIGVYRGGRRCRYMIKSEMMDNPLVRFLITHTHTVPVDRSAGAEAYAQAVENLRQGYVVGVYPEATISRSFELKDFKTGAVRMAQTAEVPIVPCIVWGAQRQWTKTGEKVGGSTRDMGRSHIPVTVRFGDPIDCTGDPVTETARLKSVMAAMLDDVRVAYGDHPPGAYWVPASMGGGAPTLAQARVIEAADDARKAQLRAARARGEHKEGH